MTLPVPVAGLRAPLGVSPSGPPAKFERHDSANGEFRGRLKSANGQHIATAGEGCTRKDGAR